MHAKGIMDSMVRAGLLALLLATGCTHHKKQLNLLEQERLAFRAENEKLRAEDLEARYDAQKKKADALSKELLALQKERDRLYGEYDVLRGDTVRLELEALGGVELHFS